MKQIYVGGCSCFSIFLGVIALWGAVGVTLGAWSVNYLLMIAGRPELPFVWAAVVGLIGGEFTLPAGLIALILRHFGAI